MFTEPGAAVTDTGSLGQVADGAGLSEAPGASAGGIPQQELGTDGTARHTERKGGHKVRPHLGVTGVNKPGWSKQ